MTKTFGAGIAMGIVGTILVSIVANGIKMSRMPAFGQHHGPEEIVALTAFVSALPGLTPDDYTTLTGSAPEAAERTPSPAGGEAEGEPQADGSEPPIE